MSKKKTEDISREEETSDIRIGTPSDLRKLELSALPCVCANLRRKIIENLSVTPGHFASSMGAVEIAVALHYVFNTPRDRIVWDVGHQAYAHKLLTGRADRFPSIRKQGGLSGFPAPWESEYDTFTAGHASNSISAALGMAIADMSTPGNEDRKTVAVIGDASISGGLAFEGLNNASNCRNNLLIILNDNDMSIDDNVGALHRYLSRLTTSKGYNRWRQRAYLRAKSRGWIGERGRGLMLRFNNSIKALVSGRQNIFEGLNIRYFGPFDGHDVVQLVENLRKIKDMEGPRILHLKTSKGKGFEAAEKDPTTWHAPGKFNPITGVRDADCVHASSETMPQVNWQQAFGEALVELAAKDERIVGITAAMPSGTSMNMLMEAMPGRAFDVGISEGHAVTFAGGLAVGGKRPFVAIYSSFLQRAYDSIIHDVAIQGLPVTFCIDRAGLVGEDGVTHHGLFDVAYLRIIPGMKVAAPVVQADLKALMELSLAQDGPMAIRYPRGKGRRSDHRIPPMTSTPGKGRVLVRNDSAGTAIVSLGPVAFDALAAADKLVGTGEAVAVYDLLWVKPLDEGLLAEIAQCHNRIITVEDGVAAGGMGTAVADWLTGHGYKGVVTHLGAPDRWVHHGSVAQLKDGCGFDAAAIVKAVRGAKTD